MTRPWQPIFFACLLGCSTSSAVASDGDSGMCSQPDQDGVIGGGFTFQVEVSDTAFSPVILKAQNSGMVTVSVKNTGTRPHDFVVQCLTAFGCVACFPDAAKIAPLQPGASATTTFTAPEQEGIYNFSSDAPGDGFAGQFILQ